MQQTAQPLPVRVAVFAISKHDGQTRNNHNKDPYTSHLVIVAELIRDAGGTDKEIAGGWGHDLFEDTDATYSEVSDAFGEELADLIAEVTDPPHYAELPTLKRKQLQAKRIAKKSRSAKLIKLADQIANVRSMEHDAPSRKNRQECQDYLKGAKQIVEACRSASPQLYRLFQEAYTRTLESCVGDESKIPA